MVLGRLCSKLPNRGPSNTNRVAADVSVLASVTKAILCTCFHHSLAARSCHCHWVDIGTSRYKSWYHHRDSANYRDSPGCHDRDVCLGAGR